MEFQLVSIEIFFVFPGILIWITRNLDLYYCSLNFYDLYIWAITWSWTKSWLITFSVAYVLPCMSQTAHIAFCSRTAHITFRTTHIASRPLPGNLTWKVLATRKLKNSTPMYISSFQYFAHLIIINCKIIILIISSHYIPMISSTPKLY